MADETERARQIAPEIIAGRHFFTVRDTGIRAIAIDDARALAEGFLALAAELDAAEKERDEARMNMAILQQVIQSDEAIHNEQIAAAEERNGELAAALRLAYPYVKDQAQEGSKALRDLVRADLDVIGPLLAASGAGEETT